jgi:hypothetical protein
MLIGMIMTMREEFLRNPQRLIEAPLKVAEVLKQLPPEVTVKSRYVFGGGDNMKAIIVFDAQDYSQLMAFGIEIPKYFNFEVYPVVDNMGEVVQQAVG